MISEWESKMAGHQTMTASWMSNEKEKSFNIVIQKCQLTIQLSLKEKRKKRRFSH